MSSIDNKIALYMLIFFSFILLILLNFVSSKKNKHQLDKSFIVVIGLMLFWLLCLVLQIFSINFLDNINPIYFENFAYISVCFLPVAFYFLSLSFSKNKFRIKKRYLLLAVVPIISLVVLWSNELHHLFYKVYSTNYSENVFGPYFYVHAIYTYLLFGISLFVLMKYSIKNAGLFSKQAILIFIAAIIPIATNILATFSVIPGSIYMTPITFAITIICLTFAIFKFNFLGIAPIAMQMIVDRISDSYVVLNENYIISDFNKTFLTTFGVKDSDIRGKDFEKFLKNKRLNFDYRKLKNAFAKTINTNSTVSYDQEVHKIGKIFTVEITSISSDGTHLGTLILFKDITQHIEDMKRIQDAQESLMESERLSSLGQLIGGIAHNLKTPIMSISGAAEGLKDLVTEYDNSIDDPEVNSQDHHDIASDMNGWINKIKEYTEYMSDIISAVKGQAVTLSETENISFDIDELFKRVDILMKHELKNARIYMNVNMIAPKSTKINGDVNSLVQVINNMISNAIQAYEGVPEKTIDLIADIYNSNLVISVRDYGCGLPDSVKDKLFKEMITTKGKNGTGLGLYMSYSTIKANFNGNITFESEVGKGTKFNIVLPM